MEVKANPELEIIDNTYYSIGFPNEPWTQLIGRSNYLSQIDDYLSNGGKLIFIEGEEDVGKTTLCALLARKYPNQTISVFFNPLNNLDYQIDFFCSNVVRQVKNILGEKQDEDEIIGTEQYRHLLFQVRKKFKKNKINFIIDGLETKVKEDSNFIRNLFLLVPFGQEIFRIIISGYKNDFLSVYDKLKREESLAIPITGFSEPEIAKYLDSTSYTQAESSDLYKITKGFPGRLKTLKRLLQKEGYSFDKISTSTTYSNWVELDCEVVNLEISINSAILSLLALTDNSFSIDEIANICGVDKEDVVIALPNLPILDVLSNGVSFTSAAHKKYFSNILRANKQKIDELLVNYYANSDSVAALIELPKLFLEKKEWPRVIELLDDKYIHRVLEGTGSLKTVNDTLALGVLASEKANRYVDLWRYSIQGSIVNELDNYLFWESEIEARMSLQDFAGAIALAESAIVLVDRLRLLALIARRQREFGNKVDEVLINLIQELYQRIDISSAGNKIYDIVADLIYALPNLAIEMIEKSSRSVGDKSINDWVAAKLSIAAIDSSLKYEEKLENSKKLEAVQNINNPSVRKINRAISFLVGNYTSSKVLEEVRKIAEPEERLKLLRLWLANSKNNVNDIDLVISKAVDELLVTSSETSTTLEVLSELSSQLPNVSSLSSMQELYKRFRSIEAGFSTLGLARNNYSYELNMFHVEFIINQDKSIITLNKILSSIDILNDTLIKLDSYAETYSKLCLLNAKWIRDKINFVYQRIFLLSAALFSATASQFKISQNYLNTIGKRNPRFALKIIEFINTVDRRERARLHVLESYLDNSLEYIKLESIGEIEDALENNTNRRDFYMLVVERYSQFKNLSDSVVFSILSYREKINGINDPDIRIKAQVCLYKILVKSDQWKVRLEPKMERSIYVTWQQIEAEWDRVDIGFTVCYELSNINPKLANTLFRECEAIKSSNWLDSKLVAFTYLNSIKLIIKAFNGLVMAEDNTIDDYRILEDLLARIPSEVEKLRLWTEIGFVFYQQNKLDQLNRVLNDHVFLIIHDLLEKKISMTLVIDTFTLIHLTNPDLVVNFLRRIPNEFHEDIYGSICNYYVTKRNPFDAYDLTSKKFVGNYNDLTKAISVLEKLKTDNDVYREIDNVCTAIKNSKSLSRPQVSSLIENLNSIVTQKLPDQRNIKHNGFKIIAQAKIASITKFANPSVFWNEIIQLSEEIPNKSDEIFVKSILLEETPFDKLKDGGNLRKKLFEDVIVGMRSLPSHYEFVQRVIDLSPTMYPMFRNAWKKIVEQAFSVSTDLSEGADIYSSQTNIIDSIYRMDPEFAKELIKQVDKENRDDKINKALNKYYETLEMTEKIKENKSLEQREKENYQIIINGIYRALKSLNADRSSAKKIAEVVEYLPIGNNLPLHEVYPIYAYYLNNCSQTYKTVKNGNYSTLIRDNFKEVVNSCNLIQLLSQKKKISERGFRKYFVDEEFSTNLTVKPNSREEAFNFIRKWIEDVANEFILIADPYFKKEDLEILKIIKEAKPDLEVDVLGSMDTTQDIEEVYKRYWQKISDEQPPFTNFTFCWLQESRDTPFHDRWIITKDGGLRIGTSINSLGGRKESEISVMRPNEALKIRENTLMEYIERRKKELNNERLKYKAFSL